MIENLRKRLKQRMSQRGQASQLAAQAGISRQALEKIANGATANPGILTVQAIEKALDETAEAPKEAVAP